MSNKQSSVEWLYNKMYEHRGNITIEEYEQAKAMHKEEMEDFGNDLLAQNDCNYIGIPNLAEHYYNETFGGEK